MVFTCQFETAHYELDRSSLHAQFPGLPALELTDQTSRTLGLFRIGNH